MNSVAELPTQRHTVPTQYDPGEHEFTGALLGFGTSHRTSHLHAPGERPQPGVRCSGCRWTETRIFWSTTDSAYVVSILGRSVLPGEISKVKTVWATDPDEVLDTLLVPPPRHLRRDGPLELPQPNEDALLEACEKDSKLAGVLKSWEGESTR